MSRASRSLWLAVTASTLFALVAFAVCFLIRPTNAARTAVGIDLVLNFIIVLAGAMKIIRPTPADEEHCEPIIPWSAILQFATITAAAAICFVGFRLDGSGLALIAALVCGVGAMLIAFIGEVDSMFGSSGTGLVMFAFACEIAAVAGGCLGIASLFS